jgi:hypothetical protein
MVKKSHSRLLAVKCKKAKHSFGLPNDLSIFYSADHNKSEEDL